MQIILFLFYYINICICSRELVESSLNNELQNKKGELNELMSNYARSEESN